jgi:hypothetical protein
MVKYIPTYELTSLANQLKLLAKRDMTASGIHIEISRLDESPLGQMSFVGELLPELIPVLLKSLEETLKLRLSVARDDIAKIQNVLDKE